MTAAPVCKVHHRDAAFFPSRYRATYRARWAFQGRRRAMPICDECADKLRDDPTVRLEPLMEKQREGTGP